MAYVPLVICITVVFQTTILCTHVHTHTQIALVINVIPNLFLFSHQIQGKLFLKVPIEYICLISIHIK